MRQFKGEIKYKVGELKDYYLICRHFEELEGKLKRTSYSILKMFAGGADHTHSAQCNSMNSCCLNLPVNLVRFCAAASPWWIRRRVRLNSIVIL